MDGSQKLPPVVLGGALALTIVIMYSLCAVAWAVWHEASLDFLNALFHGLDFRKIQAAQNTFTVSMLFIPMLVMAAWSFATGMLYAVIYNYFRQQ